jgi:hypothetical protein
LAAPLLHRIFGSSTKIWTKVRYLTGPGCSSPRHRVAGFGDSRHWPGKSERQLPVLNCRSALHLRVFRVGTGSGRRPAGFGMAGRHGEALPWSAADFRSVSVHSGSAAGPVGCETAVPGRKGRLAAAPVSRRTPRAAHNGCGVIKSNDAKKQRSHGQLRWAFRLCQVQASRHPAEFPVSVRTSRWISLIEGQEPEWERSVTQNPLASTTNVYLNINGVTWPAKRYRLGKRYEASRTHVSTGHAS